MRAALIALVLATAGCGGTPTSTGTTCPDPDPMTLTYQSFGQAFMETYCTMCHASTLLRPQRNGAPLFHDFDTLEGVLEVPIHIDQQAGSGPKADNDFMPPDRCPTDPGGKLNRDCPQPTEEERQQLSQWLACEVNRPHTF